MSTVHPVVRTEKPLTVYCAFVGPMQFSLRTLLVVATLAAVCPFISVTVTDRDFNPR